MLIDGKQEGMGCGERGGGRGSGKRGEAGEWGKWKTRGEQDSVSSLLTHHFCSEISKENKGLVTPLPLICVSLLEVLGLSPSCWAYSLTLDLA